MARVLYEITVCIRCALHHNNGECGTCGMCTDDAPTDEPLPLSALLPEERWRLALGAHEHSEYCTKADRAEGCDCGRAESWTFTCGGCGIYTSGEAHDAVIFDR